MNLTDLRHDDTEWKVVVLDGPNTSRRRASGPDLDDQVRGWAHALGVRTEHFRSNHEGELLEHIHTSAASTDGYLVDPGGLVTVGESLRHCLKDARRPTVEIHWSNEELRGTPILAPTATAVFAGLGHFTVLGALVALVLALDDADFLRPGGTSSTNRSGGTPRSLYL